MSWTAPTAASAPESAAHKYAGPSLKRWPKARASRRKNCGDGDGIIIKLHENCREAAPAFLQAKVARNRNSLNIWDGLQRHSRERGNPGLFKTWIPGRASYRQLARNDHRVRREI